MLAQIFLAAAEAANDQGFYQTLIMIAVALIFFYFILWRPEQKRRKKLEDMRTGLQKGDRVTAMGIIGTIAEIKERTVKIQVEGACIEMLIAAITDVEKKEEK
ncbi:MAG: preprotein translocase subunit YajC [Chlamydiae bacterium]|nr:preprotein translocase subunit YajC [Chlamydiota bacterium]